ncbi:MAG: hypothetical protein JWN17_3006, partial [Frankiales bacterium]|nr:hypothetical protein [Frankiales bacterium]
KSDLYDLETLLTSMGIGEAAVTILSERGAPTPVAWTRLRPPSSLMAQLDPAEHTRIVQASPLLAEYGQSVDRESAYEMLLAKVAPADAEEHVEPEQQPERQERRPEPDRESKVARVLGSSVFRQVARTAASVATREIVRSLFGTAPRRRSSTTRRRSSARSRW